MKLIAGFTLIELLVATATIGVLSVVSVQILLDAVMLRSKEDSINNSSDNVSFVINDMTRKVQMSKTVNVVSVNQINITETDNCSSFRYNLSDKSIEKAVDTNPPCNPIVFTTASGNGVEISNFYFTPTGLINENVAVFVQGEVRDAFGTHPFIYSTSVFPRVSL